MALDWLPTLPGYAAGWRHVFGTALLALALILNGLNSSVAADSAAAHRVGFVTFDTPPIHAPFAAAFHKGLAEGGYIEGQNVVVERRFASDPGTIKTLLTELLALKVDVIVTDTTQVALAAKNATRTTPIVTLSGDPVAAGLVESIRHPGGNITALTSLAPDITGKRLAYLKEMAPRTRRVAVLWNPDNPSSHFQVREARAAAQNLGLILHTVPIPRPAEIESVLASLPRIDAILLAEDGLLDLLRPRIGAFAVEKRLPFLCGVRVPDDSSCLLWYGPDLLAMYQRLGVYAGRILGGAKAADLPVEQPTKFLFSINAKTANTLGITIPQSLLAIADDVIR